MAVAETVAGASREASLPAAATPEIAGSEPPEDQKMLLPQNQEQDMSSPRSAPAQLEARPVVRNCVYKDSDISVAQYSDTQSDIGDYPRQDLFPVKGSVQGPRELACALINRDMQFEQELKKVLAERAGP